MAIEKQLGFILKILRIMDNGAVNVVKSFVGDRTGDYRYLGEIKKGKHIVSYMFTDDASTEDGAFLAVGTVQYYVVSGVECRFADDEETLWAMCSPIPEILDDSNNKVASGKGLNIDLLDVLEKYAQQRGGYSCPDLPVTQRIQVEVRSTGGNIRLERMTASQQALNLTSSSMNCRNRHTGKFW